MSPAQGNIRIAIPWEESSPASSGGATREQFVPTGLGLSSAMIAPLQSKRADTINTLFAMPTPPASSERSLRFMNEPPCVCPTLRSALLLYTDRFVAARKRSTDSASPNALRNSAAFDL